MAPSVSERSLAAREAIRELRSRYGWYIDQAEWEAWASLFAEDAVLSYSSTGTTLEGREEILTYGREVIDEVYEYCMHTSQSPRLTVDGDTGSGRWYMAVFYTLPDGTSGWVTGEYADEYRRVDGDWQFARLEGRVRHDTGEGSPHVPLMDK
jgi:ketosteroid isomerase-like protein